MGEMLIGFLASTECPEVGNGGGGIIVILQLQEVPLSLPMRTIVAR